MREDVRRSAPLMGTVVTIQAPARTEQTIERGLEWFRQVEQRCTRFDAGSELMQLTGKVGVPVPVSEILYEAVQFAVAVAEETNGAFDPTVGHSMEARGYNREYSTKRVVKTGIEPGAPASYADIELDPDARTIMLRRPLVLDLGAVAKGLAIDLAARELSAVENFSIDAGGDLYLGGLNPDGKRWNIGIRHPRRDGEMIDAVRVSNRAVCTSGDYERGEHILDPRRGDSADAVASVTVIAPNAMLADALATAAFVLGPDEGIRLLERAGVDGLIISPALDKYATRGMSSDYELGSSAIL